MEIVADELMNSQMFVLRFFNSGFRILHIQSGDSDNKIGWDLTHHCGNANCWAQLMLISVKIIGDKPEPLIFR
jgi:hypothetical protein